MFMLHLRVNYIRCSFVDFCSHILCILICRMRLFQMLHLEKMSTLPQLIFGSASCMLRPLTAYDVILPRCSRFCGVFRQRSGRHSISHVLAYSMTCHPRATYHIAGCCHLVNSLLRFQSHIPHCRVQSPGEINVMIVPHCMV